MTTSLQAGTCAEAFYRRLLVIVLNIGAAAPCSFLRKEERLKPGDHHWQEGFGAQGRRRHSGCLLGLRWFLWAGTLGLAEEVVSPSVAGSRGFGVEVAIEEQRVWDVPVGGVWGHWGSCVCVAIELHGGMVHAGFNRLQRGRFQVTGWDVDLRQWG